MHLFGDVMHKTLFFYFFYALGLHRNGKKNKITIKKSIRYTIFSD